MHIRTLMNQQTDNTGSNQRILVVEDSYLIGMQLKKDLNTLGHEVIGPAPNVKKALKLISEHEIGFAILDINLTNEDSYPIANALRELNAALLHLRPSTPLHSARSGGYLATTCCWNGSVPDEFERRASMAASSPGRPPSAVAAPAAWRMTGRPPTQFDPIA